LSALRQRLSSENHIRRIVTQPVVKKSLK